MTAQGRCGGGFGAAGALLAGTLSTGAWAQGMEPATNERALQLWAQASGAPAPAVEQTTDGGTRLEWHGGVSYDRYGRAVNGGQVLTPLQAGAFDRFQLQSDLRAASPGGDLGWFQLGATASNDHSVLSSGKIINTLQLGRTGEGYRFAFGDIPVNHSALGANIALRGALGQRYFGQTLVSGAAGVVAESWEALAEETRRHAFLRNAASLKVEHPFSQALNVYATAQTYGDQRDSFTQQGPFVLAGADGHTATAGFTYRSGQVFLNGEGGRSSLTQDGAGKERDGAYVLDGGWQGEKFALRAGRHDLGRFYTSLSGQAIGGLRETYGNATWTAAPWLSLNADVRRSVNNRPPPPAPVVTANGIVTTAPTSTATPAPAPVVVAGGQTDAFTLSANVAFTSVPGLSLQLLRSDSSTSSAAGDSRNETSGVNLQYAAASWNAGISAQLNQLTNGGAPGNDSDMTMLTLTLGRRWSDAAAGGAPTWQVAANAALNEQRQEFANGRSSTNLNMVLGISAQNVSLGALNASLMRGWITDPVTGAKYSQETYQLDAGRAVWKTGSIKLYVRLVDNFRENPLLAYREHTVGVQFVYNY